MGDVRGGEGVGVVRVIVGFRRRWLLLYGLLVEFWAREEGL